MALANQRPPTWEAVADKAAGVFEELLRKSSRYRPGWRRRPQFALVGVPSALADAVAAHANVDRYEAPANGAYKSPGEHKAAEHRGEGQKGEGQKGEGHKAGQQEAGAQEAGAQEAGAQEAGAQEAGAQEAGAQEGVDQDGPLPLSALAKIDPWRGGYDAIIGWVPELAGREAKVVERLAAEWPGRVVVLFDQALLDEALLDPDQLDRDRLHQDKAGQLGAGGEGSSLPSFSTPGARALVVSNEPTDREETARRVIEAAQARAF